MRPNRFNSLTCSSVVTLRFRDARFERPCVSARSTRFSGERSFEETVQVCPKIETPVTGALPHPRQRRHPERSARSTCGRRIVRQSAAVGCRECQDGVFLWCCEKALEQERARTRATSVRAMAPHRRAQTFEASPRCCASCARVTSKKKKPSAVPRASFISGSLRS